MDAMTPTQHNSINRLTTRWPLRIRREIGDWLSGAVCGHRAELSRPAARRWRYLLQKLALMPMLAFSVTAAEIQFAWNPSPSMGVTNYMFYSCTNTLSLTNYTSRIPVGLSCTATITDLAPGIWQFSLTAMRDGIQSDFCNILTLEVPAPPAQMRTIVLQFSGTLTNFYDVGFFKLRIP